MTVLARFTKDPQAKLDYSIDWSAWLVSGDPIASVSWAATGVTVSVSPAPSRSGGVTTVWLEGGTAGDDARVACTITTTSGRIDERTIMLRLRDR